MKTLIINNTIYELDYMIQRTKNIKKWFDGEHSEWEHIIRIAFDENQKIRVDSLQNVLIVCEDDNERIEIEGIIDSAKDGEINLVAYGSVIKECLVIIPKNK